MIINNHHPDNIIIVIDNIKYELSGYDSIEVTISNSSICCQIIHNMFDLNDNISDKMITEVSKITAIIVDSTYIISEIRKDAIVDITNEIVAYEKYGACIIYHGVIVKNAKVELKDCYSPNVKKFIAARNLILLSDANDFPIVSPIIAITQYKKIKKMVSKQNLWNIVCNKTSFVL